ncbi:MAG TPA: efflux RND transporter periplasmic adaptor subunit [Methylomirabilota bacterium]|nr:efflux RND transporter periplasmic adaptor subunit [Methylomirabilota bacterium]
MSRQYYLSRFFSHQRIPSVLLWSALLCGSLPLCGCHSARSEAAKTQEAVSTPTETPPLPVRAVTPVRRTVQRTAQGQGALFAKESVLLSNKPAGYVNRVFVDFGDKVKAGQVLAEMEREEQELQVDADESAVKQAQATHIRAQGEYERVQELFAEQIVPPQRRDAAEAEYKVAAAAVRSAEKRLAISRKRLRDTRIVSPVDGFVQQRFVNPGEYLAASSKMFEVVVIHPLKLRVPVPERYARLARIGLPMRIEVNALPGESFGGALTRIAAGVDHATRSLLVEAEIPNPEEKLRPGYFAHVTGVLGEELALFIPRTALYRFAGVERVFVVKDGVARSREVRSGVEDGDVVEIAEGVGEGDQVIVSSVERLADGMKVQLQVAEVQ